MNEQDPYQQPPHDPWAQQVPTTPAPPYIAPGGAETQPYTTYPQAGQPVYGYPPGYAPPPAKKSHVGRWVAIGVGVFLLLVVLISIPVVWLFHRASRQADAFIQPLHQRMAAGDDAGIFANSDPAYQAQVGMLRSNLLFDTVRLRLGTPGATTMKGINTSTTTEHGEQMSITYQTQFTNGPATEILTLHKTDGQYRLLGYNIKSPLLSQP